MLLYLAIFYKEIYELHFFKKKNYKLPYLSLMFISVNYELGYKFITPAHYDMCKFLCQFSFFSFSLLSQLYEDYFSRHLFKLSSDS